MKWNMPQHAFKTSHKEKQMVYLNGILQGADEFLRMVMLNTVFKNYLLIIMTVSSSRYFSALSKGECLPVKDRLELNVATQKTDTGLTPGLLKILHKQVVSQQQAHNL